MVPHADLLSLRHVYLYLGGVVRVGWGGLQGCAEYGVWGSGIRLDGEWEWGFGSVGVIGGWRKLRCVVEGRLAGMSEWRREVGARVCGGMGVVEVM